MTEINNLKELEERGCLEIGDIVNFTVNKEIIGYKVKKRLLGKTYLCDYITVDNNCIIFEVLELDKYEIAEKIYEYKIVSTCFSRAWPETKEKDYPALTRLVKELYKIIEEKDKVYTKYNRFEIMDI